MNFYFLPGLEKSITKMIKDGCTDFMNYAVKITLGNADLIDDFHFLVKMRNYKFYDKDDTYLGEM